MADESDNTPIQSRYAERFAADLKANREEQAELQGRLKQLQAEEAWLSGMQGAVPPSAEQQITPAAEEAGAPDEAAALQTVPQPRQEKATKATAAPSGGKKTARAKASGEVAPAPKKKAAVKKATEKVVEAKKTAEPPLRELVLGILSAHPGHPHLAREVHTELVEKHGRSTSIQVVRNNLESLVKKGTVEKENKQNSAMYTASEAADEVSEKVPADA